MSNWLLSIEGMNKSKNNQIIVHTLYKSVADL